jgi:tRNA (guanine-N7-)-methyltransferase
MAALDRVFVLFNDPWPKNRHAERRFIGPDNIARLHRLMPEGAELRLASDHPILIKWMVQQMRAHSHLFKWQINHCHEWLHRPTDWPPTRYEQKAISEGRKPVYLKFIRL